MSAKFEITGSAGGTIKVIEQVTGAVDKIGKAAEGAVKSTKQLNAEAQRIREALDPQEKVNRKYAELQKHVEAGRLSMGQATAAGIKYRQELGLAADEGKKAFGPSMITSIGQAAAGYASAAAAVGLIVTGLKEKAAEEERAAQRAIQSRAGLGSLSQLAANEGGTPAERRAAYARLVSEARGFVASGAASDENEAGNLLFQLAGSGLNEGDRSFAADIKASGTLQNVGGAAEAYSALKKQLGEKEVGTFREFMSKSLKAAGPAPGSFEELPIAAAQSGGSAKALGVSDEFLLAATTILGQATNDIGVGGTQLEALLKGVEDSGLKGVEGVGGMAIIDRLASLPASKQGYGGVLGDRKEAIQAFRTLRDNRAELEALLGGVAAAQGQDLAGEAAGLPSTDDQLLAARTAFVSERRRELASNEASSVDRNLTNSIRSDRQRMLLEEGRTVDAAMERGLYPAIDWIPGLSRLEQQGNADSTFLSDETRELMRRTAEAAERTEQQTRAKVATRPE